MNLPNMTIACERSRRRMVGCASIAGPAGPRLAGAQSSLRRQLYRFSLGLLPVPLAFVLLTMLPVRAEGGSQYGRPIADITVGNWTTAPLWDKLDETSADGDTTYISNVTPGTETLELRFGALADPMVSSGHTIRYCLKKIAGRSTPTADAYLYQGGSMISLNPSPEVMGLAWATNEWTLSGPEADAITDYTDLRLRIDSSIPAGVSIAITWVEIEVPTAGDPPTVTNDGGVSNLTATSVTLNGQITDTGGATPTAYFYWGPSDGVMIKSSWSNEVNVGSQSGFFSYPLSGLKENTAYYYRSYAQNGGGNDWADSSVIFTTPSSPPAVNNGSGASGVTASSATLNGVLTSTGGLPTQVWICWGDNNGGASTSAWDVVDYLGYRGIGAFLTPVSGLTANKTYWYRCFAKNSSGEAWASSAASFGTLSATIQFSSVSSSGPESVSPASLQVSLNTQSELDASVVYTVTGGSATGTGTDYTLSTGVATIPAGSTVTNITIAIAEDGLDEYDETIVVSLSGPTNASMGPNTIHTYTILDNDNPPGVSFVGTPYSVLENEESITISVSLAAQSAKTTSVDYLTVNASAIAGQDYTNRSGSFTWLPGQVGAQTFIVPIIDDTSEEGNQFFNVWLTNNANCTITGVNPAPVTILDDDMGPPIVNNEPGVSGVTANSATLRGTLVATSGAPTKVWIFWGATDAQTNKGTWAFNEALDLTDAGQFSQAVNTLSSHTPYFYRCYASNLYGSTWAPSTTNFLTGPPTIQFASSSANGFESVTTVSIELRLSNPPVYAQNATVFYSVTAGTASDGVDYVLAPGSISIVAGDTSTNIVFTVTDDNLDEYDESVIVTISNAVNCDIGALSTHTYAILDNDPAPTVFFTDTPYSADEDGGSEPIALGLSAESGKDLSVQYATANGSALAGDDYETAAGTITWLAGQTVDKSFNITIIDDFVSEGDKFFYVSLTSPSNCAVSGPSATNVTIIENDFSPPHVDNDGGATNIGSLTATLRGEVLDGVPPPRAFIYWGPTDGGTTKSAWSNFADLGIQAGPFSTDVNDLLQGPTHYYRCYVSNSAGSTWADSSTNFTTILSTYYYINDTSTVGDVYCDAVGNDGNSGMDPAEPMATIQQLLIDYDLEPNDIIWIDTGTYDLSSTVTFNQQDIGSPAGCVVLRGSTNAGGSLFHRHSTSYDVFSVSGAGIDYIRFENLTVVGGKRGIFVQGVYNDYCEGIQVVNCNIYSNTSILGAGVYMKYAANVLVSGNTCYQNGKSGLYGGIYLDHCDVVSVVGNDCFDNSALGIFLNYCLSPTVVGNMCHDHTGTGSGYYGIDVLETQGAVINDNICWNNKNDGIFAGGTMYEVIGIVCWSNADDGIELSSAGVTVKSNVVFKNTGDGIYSTAGLNREIFQNNLVYSNGGWCLYLSDLNNNAIIENNTFCGGKGIYIPDPSAVTNRNNIIWSSGAGNYAVQVGQAPVGFGVFASDYNDIYATAGANVGSWVGAPCADIGSWRSASAGDAQSISEDPLFVDPAGSADFHLQSVVGSYHGGAWLTDAFQSPCIDLGNPWSLFSSEPDYNGLLANQGAYGNTPQASKTYYPSGIFYSLSVSPQPAGAGEVSTWPPATLYPTNRQITVTSTPTNMYYDWSHWAGDLTGSANPRSFFATDNMSIQAVFRRILWAVEATAEPNGQINPSGIIDVWEGSNATFSITADPNYHIADVLVDSSSIGATNQYTFVSVTNDHTILAQFAADNRYSLLVTTPYGTAAPTGSNSYDSGSVVPCSIIDSPVAAGSATQYVCTGWAGTGSAGSGSGTNASFIITANSELNWLWSTNYWLNTGAGPGGSVNVGDGWHRIGTNVSILASPGGGYAFLNWTGDTNSTANPLVLTMSRAWSVTANFEAVAGHTITASAGPNGSISPSGAIPVPNSASTNFTITPDPNCYITNVFVDGASVGITNSYTFVNVTNDRTITAYFGVTTVTSHNTPIWWLQRYGFTDNFDQADNLDQDDDGAFTWQEYLAGTDPTNSRSVFAIVGLQTQPGSNYVSWYATTNSGVLTKFSLYRASNVNSAAWILAGSNISRTANGTNTWWDTPPGGWTRAFYRPGLPPTNQ